MEIFSIQAFHLENFINLALHIVKIEAGTIDLLKDSAMLYLSYRTEANEPNAAENMNKAEWQQTELN